MSFCKYSDIFGRPGEGVHRYRVFGVAIVDVIGTVLLAALLQYLINPQVCYLVYLAITVLLGILLHRLFCVRTTVDRALFSQ